MSRALATAAIGLLVVALLGSVFVQFWAVPSTVERVAATFPEVTPIAVPSIVWGFVATLCWQVAAVIGIRVLALVRTGNFDESAYGWLRAAIVCPVAYVLLVVFAWIALSVLEWATPGVMLGLFVSGLMALVAIVSIVRFLLSKPAVRYSSHA